MNIKDFEKEKEYILRTGNIPLCSCDDFLANAKCKHIDNLKLEVNKILGINKIKL